MPERQKKRRPLLPQAPTPSLARSVVERVLDLLGRPQAAVFGAAKAAVTGRNPIEGGYRGITGEERGSFAEEGYKRFGGIGGVAGTVLGFVSDPTVLLSGGAGAGPKLAGAGGKMLTLSRAGGRALTAAAEAERAALIPRITERLAAVRRAAATAGEAVEAGGAARAGLGDLLGIERQGELLKRYTQQAARLERVAEPSRLAGVVGARARKSVLARIAGGAKDLVDPGGLKVGLPFTEGVSVLPQERIDAILRSVRETLAGTRPGQAVERFVQSPGVRSAADTVRRLFSRRVTPVEAASAHVEDLARYGGSMAVEEAKELTAKIQKAAKDLGRDPVELREQLFSALEQPRETMRSADVRQVPGVNPLRQDLERQLLRTQRLQKLARGGRGPWRKMGALTSPTSAVEVANPELARLGRRRELAQARAGGLDEKLAAGVRQAAAAAGSVGAREARVNPEYLRLLEETQRAKGALEGLPADLSAAARRRMEAIKSKVTAPQLIKEAPVPHPEALGPGYRAVMMPKVTGSARPWPVTVEILELFDNGQALVEVKRLPRAGRRGLPKSLDRLPLGSQHIVDMKELSVPPATRAGRLVAAERKSLPQQLRRTADELEAGFRQSAYEVHARRTGSQLVLLSQAEARAAGPSVYQGWLEARSAALSHLDSELGTGGTWLKRVNASDQARAVAQGVDPATAAVGTFAPGPTYRYPPFVAPDEYRALERIRTFLAKRGAKFEQRLARLEERIRATPPHLGLEAKSAAARDLAQIQARVEAKRARYARQISALEERLRQQPKTVTVQQRNALGELMEREAKLRAQLGTYEGELPPRLRRVKQVPPHPMLEELRPRVEPVEGSDRIAELPEALRPLAARIRQRLDEMFQQEQILAHPTPKMASAELAYMPHYLTDEAKDAIARAHPDQIAAQGLMRRLSESHSSQRAREFIENIVVDERRYREAMGSKKAFALTEEEAQGLAREGIIHRRYMSAREVNQKAAAGELAILGAQFENGQLVRPGVKVQRFFSEDPALALGLRTMKHERAMGGHAFVEEMKRAQYGGRRVGEKDILPEGYVRVAKPGLEGMAFPAEAAKHIDAVVEKLSTPEELQALGKAYDSIMGAWKGWQLATPGYHLRNQVGDMVAMNIGGLSWDKMPARLREGWQIAKGGAGEIAVPGGTLSYDRVRELAGRLGVTGGMYSGELEQELAKLLEGTRWLTAGQRSKILNFSRNAGEFLENHRRYALFTERLAQGEAPQVAARHVQRYLFDYGDLTRAERLVAKRVLPFYTYPRKAVQLYVGELLKRPRILGGLGHLKRGVEAVAGGQEPDPRFIPPWIRDQYHIRFDQGKGRYEMLLLGSYLPFNAVLEATKPMQMLMDQAAPWIKQPWEMATATEFAPGTRPLVGWEGQPGSFWGAPIAPMFGGWRTERLLRSVAFLNQFDKLVSQPHRIPRSLLARAIGAFGGPLTQGADVTKGRTWAILERARELGKMRAAEEKALSGGYESEAEMIRPQREALEQELAELRAGAKAGAPSAQPATERWRERIRVHLSRGVRGGR